MKILSNFVQDIYFKVTINLGNRSADLGFYFLFACQFCVLPRSVLTTVHFVQWKEGPVKQTPLA